MTAKERADFAANPLSGRICEECGKPIELCGALALNDIKDKALDRERATITTLRAQLAAAEGDAMALRLRRDAFAALSQEKDTVIADLRAELARLTASHAEAIRQARREGIEAAAVVFDERALAADTEAAWWRNNDGGEDTAIALATDAERSAVVDRANARSIRALNAQDDEVTG